MEIRFEVLNKTQLDEFRELIFVFERVFEMKDFVIPPDDHLVSLLNNEQFIVVTAKLEGRIIGGATLYVLDQYYSVKPLAYLYDLAVENEYQRKGTGRKIISFINDHFRKKGFEEVFVQADVADDYAIDFYRSTKPSNEEDVIHFYYSL